MLIVNGETVEDKLLREEAAAMRPKYYEVIGKGDPIELEMQLREWSRENVIERVLVDQEAARLGISREDLLAEVEAEIEAPSKKEVAAFYASNRDQFWTPEAIHCAHIVKAVNAENPEEDALRAIQAVEADLARGADFQTMAEDLGWVPRGVMASEFDRVVFALAPGQTSPVFRTHAGFHIARVFGRKPEGITSLANVRERLTEEIWKARRNIAVERFVDELRAGAMITF